MVTSFTAISAGATFGLFSLGILVPWANSKGALVGGISGCLMSAWVCFGSLYVKAAGLVVPQTLPVSVDQCYIYNITSTEQNVVSKLVRIIIYIRFISILFQQRNFS